VVGLLVVGADVGFLDGFRDGAKLGGFTYSTSSTSKSTPVFSGMLLDYESLALVELRACLATSTTVTELYVYVTTKLKAMTYCSVELSCLAFLYSALTVHPRSSDVCW
jgi:hypothetical protein